MSATPAIRFEGFADPWEQRKLGEITDSYSGGTPQANNSDYYGGTIPFIRSAEISASETELFLTERGLAESSAAMVDEGCILYALYGATSGEVGISRINGAINQAILAIYPHEGFDARFLASWLRKQKDSIVATYLQGGQGNLSGTIVKDLEVLVPSQAEQELIGQSIASLDNLITLHQRKHDRLVVLKKALLDKMFPRDGSRFPELRFGGFTDPWEQRKWSSCVAISTDMVDPKSGLYDDLPHIGPGNIESFTGRLFDNVHTVKEDALISGKFHFFPGDVIYGKINPQLGKYVFAQVEGLASADAYVLNGFNGINQEFLFALLQTERFFKYSVSVSMRSGMPKINRDELDAFEFLAPKEDEQRRIGRFLRSLDNLITLHQRKLELLRNLKSACLDKMFV